MKRIASSVVSLALSLLYMIQAGPAFAAMPASQQQTPVWLVNGGNPVTKFYEDGGSSLTTAGATGNFDPLTGGTTTITGPLAVDGGVTLNSTLTVNAKATEDNTSILGTLAVDGGATVGSLISKGTVAFQSSSSFAGTMTNTAGGLSVTGGLSTSGNAANTLDNLATAGLVQIDGGAQIAGGIRTSGNAANVIDNINGLGIIGADGGVFGQGGKQVPAMMLSTTNPGIQQGHTNVGTPYTFNPTFSATPECACTDITANASVKCLTSGGPPVTTLTMTGTGTDTISFVCVGAR